MDDIKILAQSVSGGTETPLARFIDRMETEHGSEYMRLLTLAANGKMMLEFVARCSMNESHRVQLAMVAADFISKSLATITSVTGLSAEKLINDSDELHRLASVEAQSVVDTQEAIDRANDVGTPPTRH